MDATPVRIGDVSGPKAAVTDNNFASWDDTSGRLIKDSGSNASSFDTAGAAAAVQGNLDTHVGQTGTAVHGLGTMSTETADDYYTIAQSDLAYDALGAASTVQGNLDTHVGLEGTDVHGLGTMSTETAADYGKLDSANSWTAPQAFAAGLTGTSVAVTGKISTSTTDDDSIETAGGVTFADGHYSTVTRDTGSPSTLYIPLFSLVDGQKVAGRYTLHRSVASSRSNNLIIDITAGRNFGNLRYTYRLSRDDTSNTTISFVQVDIGGVNYLAIKSVENTSFHQYMRASFTGFHTDIASFAPVSSVTSESAAPAPSDGEITTRARSVFDGQAQIFGSTPAAATSSVVNIGNGRADVGTRLVVRGTAANAIESLGGLAIPRGGVESASVDLPDDTATTVVSRSGERPESLLVLLTVHFRSTLVENQTLTTWTGLVLWTRRGTGSGQAFVIREQAEYALSGNRNYSSVTVSGSGTELTVTATSAGSLAPFNSTCRATLMSAFADATT